VRLASIVILPALLSAGIALAHCEADGKIIHENDM
jgi:hypothetical protein